MTDKSEIGFYILSTNELPPPLHKIEEEKLMINKSKAAKQELILRNLRLVVYVVKKYISSGIDMEDLFSIGAIGLIKAINTYNHDKHIKLVTYAAKCIENEILMHLRKNVNKKAVFSIDMIIDDEIGNKNLLDMLAANDNVYQEIETEEERKILQEALNRLDEREKKVIIMHFGIGCKKKNQRDISDIFGMSQASISRIEKRGLKALKEIITSIE